MIYEDHGLTGMYPGVCRVCLADYEPGDLIATAPRIYHKANRTTGIVQRFAHLDCALTAREHPLEIIGGAR